MNRLAPLALGIALTGCVPSSAPPPRPAARPVAPVTTAPPPAAPGAPNPMVGGATMYPGRTVAENAATAPNLATLMSAVRTAGLESALAAPGPITVFAPTDDAFARLAPGALDTLLRPENRASLATVLRYHIVPGALSATELRARIQAGGGVATLTTAAGQPLTARLEEGVVTLTDTNGVTAYVETADVRQSNGVVHVVNGVLVPRLG